MKKARIEYLDVLRGIGILYMVFAHVNYFEKYDYYIHAFHMPLFFFITGYFFSKNEKLSWKEFIVKITKKLLIPYFVLGIFFAVFDSICFTGIGTLYSNLLSIVTTNNVFFPISGAFWYFTCLFFAMLIFYSLRKIIKNDYLLFIMSFLVMLIGVYFKKIIDIELWLSLIPSLASVGFISSGYLAKKMDLIEKYAVKNIFLLIIIGLINGFMIFKTGYVNMRTNNYPNIFLLLINFILAMLFYINISRKLDNISFLNRIMDIIKFIGKYSIVFLIFNQFIILIIKKLFIAFGFVEINILLYSVCIFIPAVIIMYILAKLIIKSKIRFIFGI